MPMSSSPIFRSATGIGAPPKAAKTNNSTIQDGPEIGAGGRVHTVSPAHTCYRHGSVIPIGQSMQRARAALVILLTGIGVARCTGPQTPAVPAANVPERVQVRSGGRIVSVPMEEYVLATTLAE